MKYYSVNTLQQNFMFLVESTGCKTHFATKNEKMTKCTVSVPRTMLCEDNGQLCTVRNKLCF